MKILEISPYDFINGGSDKYFIEICDLLTNRGHDVTKFCTENPRNRNSSWTEHFPTGINTKGRNPKDVIKLFYNFDAASKLNRLINSETFEVAHIHIYYGQFSTSILRALKSKNIPIIQTIHDYKPLCPIYSVHRRGKFCTECDNKKYYRCAINRCNRNSVVRSVLSTAEAYFSGYNGAFELVDHFIAVCDFQRGILTNSVIPESKISTLHNFAELDPTVKADKLDCFLYFGRIEYSKGIKQLIDAFNIVQKKGLLTGVELVIAGKGSYRDEAIRYTKDISVQNVRFPGHIGKDELKSIAARAYASILVPNAIENCSMSVLESLAMGVPVIAGKIGALPELVKSSENGFIVEPGDIEALSSQMVKIAGNLTLQRQLSERATEHARNHFDPQTHVIELERIFSAVLTKLGS